MTRPTTMLRTRAGDRRFRATKAPSTAMISVANLGGSDSLSIRLT
jgi:hypothetical protein